MTGMPPRRSSASNDRVRADVPVTEVEVAFGVPVLVEVDVTNLDHVIRSYQVRLLGLDPTWVDVDDARVDLFPGERRTVPVLLQLPDRFPAGRQRVGVEVGEPDAGTTAAMVDFDLLVAARESLTLAVEPASQEIGASGTVVLSLTNTGNTELDVGVAATEPERVVTTELEPPETRLEPGGQGQVTLTVTGPRPWFGTPVARVLEVNATAGGATQMRPTVLIQRPRISRRLLAFLGLLAVVTLFGFVIMSAFGSVAERAEANEQLLRQGLGEDGPVGARVGASSLSGSVSSTTAGALDGAAVELFDPGNPVVPVRSTVTTAAGGFRFAALAEGEYLLRVEVAGFDELWWPDAETFAAADTIDLGPATDLDEIDVLLVGRPGSVSGVVVGADVAGAVVAVRVPAEAIEGSELDPTPAVVASVALDATGEFLLDELPTPSTYEVVVSQPGFATEVQAITLGPGEQRDGIEVLLRAGDGRIAGTVTDTAGQLLPNVEIAATDGTTATSTRTLSAADTIGTFELRDLPTPATYTLSITADGYFAESVTVVLDEEAQVDDLAIVMTADRGSIAGRVTDPQGTPLGGVDIEVDGVEGQRGTVSLSDGDVGAWLATDLPVPGAYTLTFSSPGFTTQAVSVELLTGPEAQRSGVDVVLTPGTAAVNGRVIAPDGQPIGGVAITLDSSEVERRTVSSDLPPGAYGFDDLPPGAYTVTYSRAGSTPQTLLIDLAAGEQSTLQDIVLERQARLTGTVTRDGIGEAGVGVTAYALDDYPDVAAATTVTQTGGRFEIVGLDAPATYVVEFSVPAGGPVVGARTVFLQAGEDLDVEADL